MYPITAVRAEDIRDSRGKPTIRAIVTTVAGSGSFSVPSGASVGSGEAVALHDADGGVRSAIRNVHERIEAILVGVDVCDQAGIDARMRELDGTTDKHILGGNTLIGVSIAAAKAAAVSKGVTICEHLRSLATISASRAVPYLYANYINGGKHADSPLAIQEHMLVPETEHIDEGIRMLEEIGATLERLIVRQYGAAAAETMGDEGGYVLREQNPRVPLVLLSEAISEAGYSGRVSLALDAAASSFFESGSYRFGGALRAPHELAELYRGFASDFPLLSIEDPFEEHALEETAVLQSELPHVRIVGDDLTVTSAARIREAAARSAIRAVIIKPNQIGTLTETLEAMRAAREVGIDCIVSHRSGETDDTFIADLAFAFGAFGLKAGALRKPERRVKYERLAAIASHT